MTRAEMVAMLLALEPEVAPPVIRDLRRMRRVLERELAAAAKGGKARAEKLSARRRAAIARKGARAAGRGKSGRFTRKEDGKG